MLSQNQRDKIMEVADILQTIVESDDKADRAILSANAYLVMRDIVCEDMKELENILIPMW